MPRRSPSSTQRSISPSVSSGAPGSGSVAMNSRYSMGPPRRDGSDPTTNGDGLETTAHPASDAVRPARPLSDRPAQGLQQRSEVVAPLLELPPVGRVVGVGDLRAEIAD